MDGRRRDESLTAPILMVCLGPSPTTSGSVPHDRLVPPRWVRAQARADAHGGRSTNDFISADRDVGADRVRGTDRSGLGVDGGIAQSTSDGAQ